MALSALANSSCAFVTSLRQSYPVCTLLRSTQAYTANSLAWGSVSGLPSVSRSLGANFWRLSSTSNKGNETSGSQAANQTPQDPGGRESEQSAEAKDGGYHINILRWIRENAKTPKQRRIKDELDRGYWGDANELLKSPDGKQWEASSSLIEERLAQEFPCPEGNLSSLAGMGGSVPLRERIGLAGESAQTPTLMLMSCKRIFVQPMLDGYRVPFQAAYPNYPVFELDVVQQIGYWLLGPYFSAVLRRRHSKERHRHMLHYNGIEMVKDMREKLGIRNRYVGYAYLLDQQGRVRWKASGKPTEREIGDLIRLTDSLANPGASDSTTSRQGVSQPRSRSSNMTGTRSKTHRRAN